MIYSVCDAVLKLHQLQLRSFWTFPILRHPQGNQKQPSLKKLILFELFCLAGLIRERIVAHRSIDQRRIAPTFSLFRKKQNFWQQIVSIKVLLKCQKNRGVRENIKATLESWQCLLLCQKSNLTSVVLKTRSFIRLYLVLKASLAILVIQ